MSDLARFDRDPDALAWARGKIQATVNRYTAFADRAAAEGRAEQAATWRAIAREVRRDLIGEGHKVGEFDELLPALERRRRPAGGIGGPE